MPNGHAPRARWRGSSTSDARRATSRNIARRRRHLAEAIAASCLWGWCRWRARWDWRRFGKLGGRRDEGASEREQAQGDELCRADGQRGGSLAGGDRGAADEGGDDGRRRRRSLGRGFPGRRVARGVATAGRSAWRRSRQPKRVWRRRNAGRDDERGREPGSGPQSPGRAALQAGLRRARAEAQSNFTAREPDHEDQQRGIPAVLQRADGGRWGAPDHRRDGATGQRPGSAGGDADEINETFGGRACGGGVADAGYCLEAASTRTALGREGKSQVAVDPARLPATHRIETGAPRGQSPVRATQVARDRRRTGLGSRRCSDSDDSASSAWRIVAAKCGTPCALNIERPRRATSLRPLACQRCSGAAQCPSTAYETESLPFRPSGLGFPSQSRAGQMSTLGPKSHLSGGRAPIAQHQNFYGARS